MCIESALLPPRYTVHNVMAPAHYCRFSPVPCGCAATASFLHGASTFYIEDVQPDTPSFSLGFASLMHMILCIKEAKQCQAQPSV